MSGSMTDWSPTSWRSKSVAQDVVYPAEAHDKLQAVSSQLARLPPLVLPEEVERLRAHLANVAQGKAFLLQGGDCAETFAECSHKPLQDRISLMLIMSLVLVHGARTPVVRILRGAGQYAKPRSKATEMIDGKEYLSFRGDNVNSFDLNDRTPDPQRLLSAYFHSAATLNFIRTLLASGYADLHHPRSWSFAHVRSPKLQAAFNGIVDRLEDSLDFMRVIGADQAPSSAGPLSSVDLFTSHEGLLLEYEEPLTRDLQAIGSDDSCHYNVGAHFLWIGDRTRQLTGAHIEYFRGLRNPIGLKCGPTLEPEELLRLLDILDPDRVPGRVTLISRYGADKVDKHLPGHVAAVQRSGHCVVFACDPMHGNTRSEGEVKTRRMADIVLELSRSIQIHERFGNKLNGVHLEMTGESVTECLGGSMELDDLSPRYQTFCDPRLNAEQSLDVAFLISAFLQSSRKGVKVEHEILEGLC